MRSRNRTPLQIIGYGVYLYFLGLSFRNAANKALSFLHLIQISHVSIWNWIQKYRPPKFKWKKKKKKKINEYIIDEIVVNAGFGIIMAWLVAVEPTKERGILAISISKERNMFVAECFLAHIIKEYGNHSVSTDGGT